MSGSDFSATLTAAADKPGYAGQIDQFSQNSDFNAHSFLINQVLSTIATSAVVRVVKVTNAGGVAPVGLLDVQPMVAQVDGAGNTTPHGVIHNLPYFRLQGGTNAIILDPVVGDIGLAVFASRDISTVKAAKQPGPPGSRRRFDWADGLYLGGFLNGTPTQYVAFAAGGISITSGTAISVTAPTVTVHGNLAVTGSVVGGLGGGDQVSLQTHQHGTGSPAAGTTAPTAGT